MQLTEELTYWKMICVDPNETESWGCLHLYQENANSKFVDELRLWIEELYQAEGLKAIDWRQQLDALSDEDQRSKLFNTFFPEGSLDLKLNLATQLTADDVFVFAETCPGWIAVMSKEFEWTLPGMNPLALKLSAHYPVLATTFIQEKGYREITLYEKGRASRLYLNGLDRGRLAPEVQVAEFDWRWFENKGSAMKATELKSELEAGTDLREWLEIAGPDARGLRNAFLDAPLSDYDPKSFLLFR